MKLLVLLATVCAATRTIRDLDTTESTFDIGGKSIYAISFNLEGRGGNQADAAGQQRRALLAQYFESMCLGVWKKIPDVVLTQEDITGRLNSCFKEVVSCESEHYWWNEKYKFGEPNGHMLNKIYVHELSPLYKLQVKASVAKLTTEQMTKDGLNPRCVSLAEYTLNDGKKLVIGSFHASGGYVDDEAASTIVSNRDAEKLSRIKDIRGLQLRSMIERANGAEYMMLGGDTNGFPIAQAKPCQIWRIENILMNQWKEKSHTDLTAEEGSAMIEDFLAYITIPEGDVESKVKRVQEETLRFLDGDEPENEQRGEVICSSTLRSTSAWGGQPDQFYTNMPRAAATVIGGVGLGQGAKKPFGRLLSDHNPIALEVTVPGLADMVPGDLPSKGKVKVE